MIRVLIAITIFVVLLIVTPGVHSNMTPIQHTPKMVPK
jgi:hypothetical protein